MIGVLASFILSAILVSALPADFGLELSFAVLLPLAFTAFFDFIHWHLTTTAQRNFRRLQKGDELPRFEARFWPLVLLHVSGFLLLQYLGWNRFVQGSLGLGAWPLVGSFVSFAPWLLVHLSWLLRRRKIYEDLRPDPWSVGSYLSFHFRLLILPAIPCAVVSLSTSLLRIEEVAIWTLAVPSLSLMLSLLGSVIIICFSPFWVRFAVASESMADGPLRDSFEELAQRANFKCLDIRVAKTHGRVMNAAFVGVLGRLRYVFMSDGILERLPHEDLVGVFAHEMGHSRRRHILFNLALFLGLTLMFHMMNNSAFDQASPADGWFFDLLLNGMLFFGFIVLVFSPVARSFETEADVFAGETLQDHGPIKRSLESLGAFHPKRMERGGLVHPSIKSRTAFLDRYFSDEVAAEDFRGKLKRIKRGIKLFFFVPLGVWLLSLPPEFEWGKIKIDALTALNDRDAARAETGLKNLSVLLERGFEDPRYRLRMSFWTALAVVAQEEERFEDADPYVALMRSHRSEFEELHHRYNAAIVGAQQAAATAAWPLMVKESREATRVLETLRASRAADDEEVLRELRDLELLAGVETLCRRSGILPRSARLRKLSERDGELFEALRDLGAKIEAKEVFSGAQWAADRLADLEPGWRRRSLHLLGHIVGRAESPKIQR